MATARTTAGYVINKSVPEFVTLYAPDGSPHVCAPVDAREILAGDGGYTTEPPSPAPESDEQQPQQQPVIDDAAGEAAEGKGNEENQENEAQATPPVGQTIIEAALAKVAQRKRGRPSSK